MYKSSVRPLCRTCAKPISKATKTVYVADDRWNKSSGLQVPEGVYSLEDCRKHTNEQIVSVRYHDQREGEDKRRVWFFRTWDGESYTDEWFCSNICGERFGRMAAASGKIQSRAYAEAMRKLGHAA